MAYSGSSAHSLSIARINQRAVAHRVLVRKGPVEDIRDDLHIPMRVHGERSPRSEYILVDHTKRTEPHPLPIVILVKGKSMARVQPAVIASAALCASSNLDHRNSALGYRLGALDLNLILPTLEFVSLKQSL